MSLFYLRFTNTYVNMNILRLLSIHLLNVHVKCSVGGKISSDYATNLYL